MDAFHPLLEKLISSALHIRQHDDALGRCILGQLADDFTPRHVNRHRLGDKHMLARRHSIHRLLHMEKGRTVDGHGIHMLKHLFIAIETAELPVGGDAKFFTKGFHAILKVVAGGSELKARILSHNVRNKGAAPAAADIANFKYRPVVGGFGRGGGSLCSKTAGQSGKPGGMKEGAAVHDGMGWFE